MTQQKKSYNRQRKDGFQLAVGQKELFDMPDQTPSSVEKKFPENLRLGDLRQRIIDLHQENSLVVEDDRLLTFELWEDEGLEEILGPEALAKFQHWYMFEATDADSIKRSRRSLTSRKHGPPVIEVSEETEKNRKKHATAWKKHWSERDKQAIADNAEEHMQKYLAFLKSRAGVDVHGIPPFE